MASYATKDNLFLYEIGEKIVDEKRNLIILDREFSDRNSTKKRKGYYYKIKCNKCGFDGSDYYDKNKTRKTDGYWIEQGNLKIGQGCGCCCRCSQLVDKNINSIYATNQAMFEMLVNKEDGYKYTQNSNEKLLFRCSSCKNEKYIEPYKLIKQGLGCDKCPDNLSMGEKYIMSLLNQLNINYIYQYSPEWIGTKRYDFYFVYNGKSYIVEVDGGYHRQESGHKGVSLEKIIQNDIYKEEIAKINNIDYYIRLDYETYDYNSFEENILDSFLKNLPLDSIDWGKCRSYSSQSRIKEVCELWEMGQYTSITKGFREICNLSYPTIKKYLQTGASIGLCNYKK